MGQKSEVDSMPRFLIMRLDGPMQAWGTHTYEDYRPSNLFPTRSALVGLLGACLGIDRNERDSLDRLGEILYFTVRVDRMVLRLEFPDEHRKARKSPVKIIDYHTVLEARRANRPPRDRETIETRREYLFDAFFTVAVGERGKGGFHLDYIAVHLRKPIYTPFLGRRSCPITRPLFCEEWQEAANGKEALDKTPFAGGVIYAEEESLANDNRLLIRDVPQYGHHRNFGTRIVYVHPESREGQDVSEPN